MATFKEGDIVEILAHKDFSSSGLSEFYGDASVGLTGYIARYDGSKYCTVYIDKGLKEKYAGLYLASELRLVNEFQVGDTIHITSAPAGAMGLDGQTVTVLAPETVATNGLTSYTATIKVSTQRGTIWAIGSNWDAIVAELVSRTEPDVNEKEAIKVTKEQKTMEKFYRVKKDNHQVMAGAVIGNGGGTNYSPISPLWNVIEDVTPVIDRAYVEAKENREYFERVYMVQSGGKTVYLPKKEAQAEFEATVTPKTKKQ